MKDAKTRTIDVLELFKKDIADNNYSENSEEYAKQLEHLYKCLFLINYEKLRNMTSTKIEIMKNMKRAESFSDDLLEALVSWNDEGRANNNVSSKELWDSPDSFISIPLFIWRFSKSLERLIKKHITENSGVDTFYKQYIDEFGYALSRYSLYINHLDLLKYDWIKEAPETDIIDLVFCDAHKAPGEHISGQLKYSTAINYILKYRKQINTATSSGKKYIPREELYSELAKVGKQTNKMVKERNYILFKRAWDLSAIVYSNNNPENQGSRNKNKYNQDAQMVCDVPIHEDNYIEHDEIILSNLIELYFEKYGEDRKWAEEIFKHYIIPRASLTILGEPAESIRAKCYPEDKPFSNTELIAHLKRITGEEWDSAAIKEKYIIMVEEISEIFNSDYLASISQFQQTLKSKTDKSLSE